MKRVLLAAAALLAVLVGVALGVAAVVHGEADDSPGLQLLGALLAVAALVLGVRGARRGPGARHR